MSILRLCLNTMRLNLQFRWFPHTKECLWEITRCYIFNSAKHSNLKAEEVEFTVWRTVKTGDTSQLIKWLPAGEKSKYRQTWMTSPEPILQPTNDLYPLLKCCSHYKTTIEYTLHLHKSFSKNNHKSAWKVKVSKLLLALPRWLYWTAGRLEWFWDEPRGRDWGGDGKKKFFKVFRNQTSLFTK